MLFKFIAVLLELGEGEEAKQALQSMQAQKGFELLWMGYTSGEKQAFRQKCLSLNLDTTHLK